MTNFFFTADTHFGHKAMVERFRPRLGASSVGEHDEMLIDRWNSTVGQRDTVFHLGDLSFHNRAGTTEILSRLNGQIFFIKGNHDKASRGGSIVERFEWVGDYKTLRIGEQYIVMFHFPIDSWHMVGRGSWHLHGHCHGNLPPTDRARMDVGVDAHPDFKPFSFEEVSETLKDRKGMPEDHHAA